MTVAGAALEQLRQVESAVVSKGDHQAAALRRKGDDVVFGYLPEYLDNLSLPAISSTLPKTAARLRTPAGAVPAFFAGLLPEGLRLTALTAATRTSVDDHLSLLLAVGTDLIGDVRVTPGGAPFWEASPFLTEDAERLILADVFAAAISADSTQRERVALPGVQVKVSAQLQSVPVRAAAGPAILKLNPPGYDRLVENEQFFLSMAAACGLRVPVHRLVHDRAGAAGLLVQRFDRVITESRVERLAQEDACQVLDRYPAAKYRITLQAAIQGLADVVDRYGGSRSLAVRTGLEIAAFSYLIGNGDLHGKNLSVGTNERGIWEVTPAYDLLSTQPYLRWSDPMALPLYGRSNRLGLRWWVEAAQRLGLPPSAMPRRLARMTHAAAAYLERLPEIGFDRGVTQRLHDLITSRIKELQP